MATARIALGSVFGTVTDAANSVSSLVNAATKSIGMLDTFVTAAAEEQSLRARKNKHSFVKNLLREAAQEEAEANLKVVEFCKKSDNHAQVYGAAYNEFAGLFAQELNIPNTTKDQATSIAD